MTDLPPWANGPFELIVHAEEHLRKGEDFDRRISLISFDNAIEVSITTYLTLHPIQRGSKEYANSDVEKWLQNYHTKLDFLKTEIDDREITWEVDRGHIIFAHDHRNEQYHGGNKGTPEKSVLALIRKATIWIFSLLFDVPDIEQKLEQAIAERNTNPQPQKNDKFERAIDKEYPMAEVGDQTFYASEILFSLDYAAYCEIGARLSQKASPASPEGDE